MKYSSLYDLITFLQYGTKLHIGVLFFGDYGNSKLNLPRSHKIHSGNICEQLKLQESGYRRCFACRQLAVKKAIREKKEFAGLCINGIYEYTRPVLINNECACMIFIGNILEKSTGLPRLQKHLREKEDLIHSLEPDFTIEQCKALGAVLESYIRILLEQFPTKESNFNPLIENIKNYINLNLEFDIKLSEIADIFHYNEQYLGRLFKKETGQNVIDYVNRQRLLYAKKLLEETQDKVVEIAAKSGFNNVTYFNRLFQREYRLTPTQYRKQSAH